MGKVPGLVRPAAIVPPVPLKPASPKALKPIFVLLKMETIEKVPFRELLLLPEMVMVSPTTKPVEEATTADPTGGDPGATEIEVTLVERVQFWHATVCVEHEVVEHTIY